MAQVANSIHGLLANLPAPVQQYVPVVAAERPSFTPKLSKQAPPYGTQERRNYVPRRLDDYADGGAFPEIRIAQFPLDMGRKDKKGSSEQTLALTVGANGAVNYDASVKQGANRDKWVVSDHGALVPKIDSLKDEMARPSPEEYAKTAAETAAALNLVVSGKIASQQPKTLPTQPGAPEYIKYTPSQQGPQYNSGATQRIIKMQNMPIDPMEPPKFRHKKVPRGPGSPPVPVMHSPPRPVTVKDMQDWKIPPCISNWKNAKGYCIPLEKRLAADGRGLQEVQINDQFAKFAESLYVAESKARESVEMRQQVMREQKIREKETKEAELRELAMRARHERAGGAPVSLATRTEGWAAPAPAAGGRGEYLPPPPPGGPGGSQQLPGPPGGPPPASAHGEREDPEDRKERRQREDIRQDRKHEREREVRLASRDAHGGKRTKLTRDRDRDISEKVALGQANVGATGGEAMYDQRLFNRDQGMGQGLANDEGYNLYDKALFVDRGSNLFKPSAATADDDDGPEDEAVNTARFKPDKGFSGVDYGGTGGRSGGPVQFEKDAHEAADPFGLDQLVSTVSGKKKKGALDGIGKGGAMGAGSGGGSYDDYAGGSSDRRMDFKRGGA